MAATQIVVIPPDWDAWLERQDAGAGFCQTSAWARIHAAVNGVKPLAISVMRHGERTAGALMGLESSALQRAVGVPARLRALAAGRHRGALVCFEGPVLSAESMDAAESTIEELLSQADTLAREHQVRDIRFAGPPPLAAWAESVTTAEVFARFGYRATNWLTSVVDLSPDEDILRKNLRQAARKGIRKCMEAGVCVRFCETFDDYMRYFCAAYYEGSSSDCMVTAAQRSKAFWKADSQRHYRFFVAENADGQVLATLGTYAFNGVATEIMSARTGASQAANLPAQDLLHWDVMLAHKAAGDRWFNLGGYSPDPATEKEAGIRRFKEKWGGVEKHVPQFSRSSQPPHMRALRGLMKLVRS